MKFANRLLRKEVWVDEDGNIVDPHEIPENNRGQSIFDFGTYYVE